MRRTPLNEVSILLAPRRVALVSARHTRARVVPLVPVASSPPQRPGRPRRRGGCHGLCALLAQPAPHAGASRRAATVRVAPLLSLSMASSPALLSRVLRGVPAGARAGRRPRSAPCLHVCLKPDAHVGVVAPTTPRAPEPPIPAGARPTVPLVVFVCLLSAWPTRPCPPRPTPEPAPRRHGSDAATAAAVSSGGRPHTRRSAARRAAAPRSSRVPHATMQQPPPPRRPGDP